MNLTKKSVSAVACVLMAAFGQANAQLVYDNGPINGNLDGWIINGGDAVSDSFTVSAPTALAAVQAGIWDVPSDTVTSVQWLIGTTPFGSQISSGTSATTDTSTGLLGFGSYAISEDVFGISGTVGPGTYYLTLQNAASVQNQVIAWDENNGPSTAFETPYHDITGSESFQIYAGSAPDGGLTFGMLGSVMTGIEILRRKSASRK